MTAYLTQAATLSGDGTHRYRLERMWRRGAGTMLVVMLNPSTASAMDDDPTIRRCVGLADRNGYGRLVVVNLYSYRATDPRELFAAMKAGTPVTDDINDDVIEEELDRIERGPDLAMAAWGAAGGTLYPDRVREVLRYDPRPSGGHPWHSFGDETQGGHPRHPLYVRNDAPLYSWEGRS